MQSIDTRDIDSFDRTLAELLEEAPEDRRALHEDLSLLLKSEVDAAVLSLGIDDSHGDVRRWQIRRVGKSKKGEYAAISAAGSKADTQIKKGKEIPKSGLNSPGAITNYLEGGHKIRTHKGGKGYRPRIRVSYVNGFHFYQSAGTGIEAKAISMAEGFADKLAAKLEGGLS